MNKSLDSD
jgi:hypothetical protein